MRAVNRRGEAVRFTIDGRPAAAVAGDSILAAMLLQGFMVRSLEFGGEPRAGFCLMGACQDCWVWVGEGGRMRACTTPVTEGMRISTIPPVLVSGDG